MNAEVEITVSPLTFRAAEKNRQQLAQLATLWNDANRSRVIIRCIEWAWMMEIGQRKFDLRPSEIDIQKDGS